MRRLQSRTNLAVNLPNDQSVQDAEQHVRVMPSGAKHLPFDDIGNRRARIKHGDGPSLHRGDISSQTDKRE